MGGQLKPVTVRFTEGAYDAIREIASEQGWSMADTVRKGFDMELVKYLDTVRYMDYDQGKEIQRRLMDLANLLQGISGELRRIGVNYNQDIRLRLTALKSADGSGATLDEGKIELRRKRLMLDLETVLSRYETATKKVGDELCRMPWTCSGTTASRTCRA